MMICKSSTLSLVSHVRMSCTQPGPHTQGHIAPTKLSACQTLLPLPCNREAWAGLSLDAWPCTPCKSRVRWRRACLTQSFGVNWWCKLITTGLDYAKVGLRQLWATPGWEGLLPACTLRCIHTCACRASTSAGGAAGGGGGGAQDAVDARGVDGGDGPPEAVAAAAGGAGVSVGQGAKGRGAGSGRGKPAAGRGKSGSGSKPGRQQPIAAEEPGWKMEREMLLKQLASLQAEL
eukprot:118336-Chlamydomonas_euryale.AAC.1